MAVQENRRYQCTALLGRGGMGQVWAAQDQRLARTVALKRAAPASQAARRLQREAEICARLEHPNIVPIYDAGVDEAGEPWYAMRLVRGQTLLQKLEGARELNQRLELLRPMLAVCQAVGYAHQRGVVHRDLKPENVMIGAHGEVQVLDWGLARHLSGPEELDETPAAGTLPAPSCLEQPQLTQLGAVMGTPRYMSPEASRGERVGPAGDVWSLGAMLHHLVYGDPPRPTLQAPGALHAAAAPQPAEAPVELLAIVAKALAAEPAQRYRDAADLAEDLANWLDGKRIRAHAYTPGQLMARLVRAWRGPLTVAAVALLLLAGLGTAAVQRLAAERDRAKLAEITAKQALLRADAALTQALQGAALDAAAELAQGEAEVLATAAPGAQEDPLIRGVLAGLGVDPQAAPRRVLPLPPCAVGAWSRDGQRLFCWQDGVLRSLSVATGAEQWRAAIPAVQQLVADRSRVALVSHSREPPEALVLAAESGAELQRLALPAAVQLHAGQKRIVAVNAGWLMELPADNRPMAAIQHPCGPRTMLAAAGVGSEDDSLVLACGDALLLAEAATLAWQPLEIAGKPMTEFGLSAVALDHRGGLLAVGNTRGQLAAADLRQRRWMSGYASAGGMIRGLQVHPGSAAVLASVERGGGLLWDPLSQGIPRRLPWNHAKILGFSLQGQILSAGTQAAEWSLRPAKPPVLQLVGDVGLTSAHAQGERLAVSAGDGSAVVVHASSGRVLARLPPGTSVAKRVSFSADGAWLAVTATGRPYLQIYAAETWQRADSGDADAMIRRSEFAKDRLLVTTPQTAGGPLLYRLSASGQLGEPLLRSDAGCSDGAVAHGGSFAVWLTTLGGRVLQSDLGALEPPRLRLSHPGAVAVDVSSDGRSLAIATGDGVWLHRQGQPSAEPLGSCACRLLDVDLDTAAELVAAPSSQGPVYVWSLKERRLVAELRGHRGHAVHASFAPDGDLLTAGWDGTVRRWSGPLLHGSPLPSPAATEQRWALPLPAAMARPR